MQNLLVKPKPPGQHGNSKAECWRYFGSLTNADGRILEEDRLYCQLCLEAQKELGDKGHISQVSNFKSSTSTGNMNLHLSQRHDISTRSEGNMRSLMGYITKYSDSCGETSTRISDHEVTRDMVIWFCRDLLAFENAAKAGFLDFFKLNAPSLHVPSPITLGGTALEDTYQAVRNALKAKIGDVNSVCVMFDGWTDRYKARSYLGVRASFLQDDWSYNVVTLSCHVLPSHTARDVADHVTVVLKNFFVDPKKMYLTSCHDGAANMVKTSKLLKVESFQHCTAHCLHLLLTKDSILKFADVVEIIQKCRSIVTALHFKTSTVEEEVANTEDKAIVSKLQNIVANISGLLDLDDQFSSTLNNDDGSEIENNVKLHSHSHTSLKAACPTRWNSTLEMLESVSDLQREVQNSLKLIGRADLALHADELDFIHELVTLLKPFRALTEMFSLTAPTLSTIPLIKVRIRKICAVATNDDDKIKQIKEAVLNKLNDRFPISNEVMLHQVLDPDTKDLLPRADASVLLENAVQLANDRGYISVTRRGSSSQPSGADDPEVMEPELKRRRMKMELLQEIRNEAQSGNEISSEVRPYD